MIRKIFLILLSFVSLLISETISASIYSNLHPSFIIALGNTSIGKDQNIWLAHTPDPGLQNNFASNEKGYGTFLLGLALEKTFFTNFQDIEFALGLEADYLRNHSLTGIVHPMVNVAPDFDTLNYTYSMNVYTFLATAKLIKHDIIYCLGAYLQLGLGGAITRLMDYTETSPPGSSAAPMLAPFQDKSTTNFAYFIGAGFSYQVNPFLELLLGYRYFNPGSADFNPSPVQQTHNTPSFSYSHHLVTFSLVL